MTFNDDESYALFLILDTLARSRNGNVPTVNHFRLRLLPVYRDWHKANPHKVHPAYTVRAAADSDELLARQEARDNLRLIDHIADKIGLPKDQELSQENFDAWAKASTEVK
jgi:hypothetical protein